MENIPIYVSAVFILTTLISIYIFYQAANHSKKVVFILLGWILLQAIISAKGFYTVTHTLPPRFLLLVLPPLISIVLLFITYKGRAFIQSLKIKQLTLLHVVRIPVELVLFWLSMKKLLPGIMTFEGWNYDIFSGISSIAVYYFLFTMSRKNKKLLLAWNIICLLLLLNIVIIAVLSAPFRFQQLAFDQPNIAILYFPFSWLPGCIVPLVLLSHLASIYQLYIQKDNSVAINKTMSVHS